MADPVLARVLRAIALSRTPGFNFPGYFLELSYDRVVKDRAAASLDTGPHNVDAHGEMGIGPLALLADMTLAASMREAVGVRARIATVSMHLQLTGAPRTGRVSADASFDGFVDRAADRQGLTRVRIRSARKLVATGTGTFMVLGTKATPPHPLPKRTAIRRTPLLDPDHLDAAEEQLYRHALAARKAQGPFLDAFWGCQPRRTRSGARATVRNGPHIGNRVGHVQGGVSFGLACATAAAALRDDWRLVAASSWYIGPGTGRQLRVHSTFLHQGSMTAVVRTRITNEDGRGILEAVTSHARGQAAAEGTSASALRGRR